MDNNVVLTNITKLIATAEVDGEIIEIEIPHIAVLSIVKSNYHETVKTTDGFKRPMQVYTKLCGIEIMLRILADSDTGEHYNVTKVKEKNNMLNHMTEEGDTLLLAEMKDSHLENTIKMHLNTMQKAVDVLDEMDKADEEGKKFKLGSRKDKALYGIIEVEDLVEQAEDKLQNCSIVLAPYIQEVLIRDSMVDFFKTARVDLQKILGRKERFIHPARQFQLMDSRGYRALEGEVEFEDVQDLKV